jgi:cytoskeletal protein RodZ
MSSTPFGEHLRREREMRGVSLDEIAAATRISVRFLEALENEHWDQLPGGAFNRGFIRSIARFLGIDEDGLVAEYAYGREGANGARTVAASENIPRNYRPAIVAAVLAALLIAGGVWSLKHYSARMITGIHNRFAASANSMAENAPPAAPSSVTSGAASTAASSTFASADSNHLASVANPNGTAAPADPPPAAAQDLVLTITATKRAVLAVTADGKTAFSGKLRSSEAKQFEAHETIEIVSRKSSALSLSLNGHSVSWAGTPNDSRKMKLTRSDLSTPAEPSH